MISTYYQWNEEDLERACNEEAGFRESASATDSLACQRCNAPYQLGALACGKCGLAFRIEAALQQDEEHLSQEDIVT